MSKMLRKFFLMRNCSHSKVQSLPSLQTVLTIVIRKMKMMKRTKKIKWKLSNI